MTAAHVRLPESHLPFHARNQQRLQAIDAQIRLLEAHWHPHVGIAADWRGRTLKRVRRKWEAVVRAASLLPEDHLLQTALENAIVDVQESLGRLRQSG